MRNIVRQEDIVPSERFFYASILFVILSSVLFFRLWYLQIYKGDYYKEVAERNRIRRIEIPAPRGVLFDRNGNIVLGNFSSYDLVMVPQYLYQLEMTFEILSRLLHIPETELQRAVRVNAGRPKYLPITLKRNLSIHEVSTVEANKIFLPGIEIRTAPRRDYNVDIPPHLLGYLAEIDQAAMESLNKDLPNEAKYLPGDLTGKQGLEMRFEQHLRGKNGYRLIQVDAFGRQVDLGGKEQSDWDLPERPARRGNDLELTLDWDLQRAAKDAFRGKYGALLAINPQTGEILAMLSEPGFDPGLYQRSVSAEEWNALIYNPFKPMFDKTTGGEYIPGSIYKTIVAIAGLEEGVIDANTSHFCNGQFTLGDQTFHCWEKHGHGQVGLHEALVRSCDVFFYQVGVELGVDRIAKYAREFGLGKRLGVNLNWERPGLIPTSAWKKTTYGLPWTGGDTPNIAIGQGYNLLTPIQMVSMYAAVANGGKLWRPYVVKAVSNSVGEVIEEFHPDLVQEVTEVKPETFKIIRDHLQGVVMQANGTGKNAAVEGVTVAGKTGSAQVVSLRKNSNNKNDDVSLKWKEHALFAAFSPTENAEIAVAIVSENDAIGGGGAQAAPVAGQVIRRYWELKKEREEQAKNLQIVQKKIAKSKQDDAKNGSENGY